LTLTATNIDVSITTEIEAEGEAWGGCLPSAQLYALVKLLNDETITFQLRDGDRMEIKAVRARHKLPVMSADAFPQPEQLAGDEITLNLTTLNQMISATAFTALPVVDHLKPADIKYTGLSLRSLNGKLEAMASCKGVTAIAEIATDAPPFAVILPRQAATALQRLEGEMVTIKHSENLAVFSAGPRTITARQLVGQFPQWRQFVPEFPWTVSLSAGELQAAIKRAAVTMGVDNAVGYEPMRATFSRESLLVETRGGDKGKSEEHVQVQSNMNGDELPVGFINGQVLSVLAQCGESVTCHLAAWDKPLMFKPKVEGIDLTYIIMPVSTKW
jgi:DNA polymerase III sliding clamp (beta) subunit (PCNA family)